MHTTATRLLNAALLWAAATGLAHADVYVVVRADSPAAAPMTKLEVRDLFMGRTRAFANGTFAQPFNLPHDDERRAAFHQALTGLNPAQINSYWSRLMFSGQTMPPRALDGEEAMREALKHNPNAIGYLSHPPKDAALRVVLVLKEQA